MNSPDKRKVAVVGGGAAGLAAAVAAAHAGAEVVVLEKANRVGKKLLKTGNGRCNLSNENVAPDGYNRPEFAAPVLEKMPCAALRAFFASLGLETVSDAEGRVYPRSDTANSVLDVLRLAAEKAGVQEVCSKEIVEIQPLKTGGFQLKDADGGEIIANKVVFSCGGGEKLTKSLHLPTEPYTPVLCPLKTDVSAIRGLSGLRVKAEVTLLRRGETVYAERGEVLFRDYGVSGIVILNMSRYAQKGDELALNLLPDYTADGLRQLLARRPFAGTDILTGLFHRRVAEALYAKAGSTEAEKLAAVIRDFRLTVQGCADVQNAQVTRGGLKTDIFNPENGECRTMPGFYAVGEALDIDGRCGGYNLHWAFSSGLTAGRSAALD